MLQWEDFKQHNALRILERYRHRLPSFNDDIQGTGATVLAGLLAARREAGGIAADRILILGAGAAAIGIARLLRQQLESEDAWSDGDPVQIALMSSRGLVHSDDPGIADAQVPLAIETRHVRAMGLSDNDVKDPEAVARVLKPTVLIGTTGCADAFTEQLVREVARHAKRPIVLPLSNPTNRQEADPADILAWTGARALVATGSPAASVVAGSRTQLVGQANNVFVFPGVGLGAIVVEAREIPDETFLVAARTLAAQTSSERLERGGLYPPISGASEGCTCDRDRRGRPTARRRLRPAVRRRRDRDGR